jgi:hypothetical protein
MLKPAMVMLLSRHPYAERSGRASVLRQRIEQARSRFDVTLIIFGHAAGGERDRGLIIASMADPAALALNGFRLPNLPLQTWLYYSVHNRALVERVCSDVNAAAVYVDMLRLAPLTEGLPSRIARVVDYDDLLSARYAQAAGENYQVMGFLAERVGPLSRLARMLAKPLLRIEASRCADYEKIWLKRANLALFTSPVEAARIKEPGANIVAAPPLVPWLGGERRVPGEKLIFLGNMHYAENVLMLRALAQAVETLEARAEAPSDLMIDVVGDAPTGLERQFKSERFRFQGRLDELTSLAGAGLFLAPVVSGSGVKLKVLDGLALGCPVVATPKACEGLDVRPNRDLIVAPDSLGVLRTAIVLRDRTSLKAKLAARGRAYVEQHHAPRRGEVIADAMSAAVRAHETL